MRKDKLLTLPEASLFLNMNEEVVRRKAKAKEVPGSKILGTWRFYKPDLVEFLRSGYAVPDEVLQANIKGVKEKCQLAKEKAASIIQYGSPLKASQEYKDLLNAQREKMRKGMKRN